MIYAAELPLNNYRFHKERNKAKVQYDINFMTGALYKNLRNIYFSKQLNCTCIRQDQNEVLAIAENVFARMSGWE